MKFFILCVFVVISLISHQIAGETPESVDARILNFEQRRLARGLPFHHKHPIPAAAAGPVAPGLVSSRRLEDVPTDDGNTGPVDIAGYLTISVWYDSSDCSPSEKPVVELIGLGQCLQTGNSSRPFVQFLNTTQDTDAVTGSQSYFSDSSCSVPLSTGE